MSDIRARVVAKVTNTEYVPTRTVELREDQAVVDQLKPSGWTAFPPTPDSTKHTELPQVGTIVDGNAVIHLSGVHVETDDGRQYAHDVVADLNEELDAVLYPDTRVLRNIEAEFQKPLIIHLLMPQAEAYVSNLPPMGAPDSSEITAEGEYLTEAAFREPARDPTPISEEEQGEADVFDVTHDNSTAYDAVKPTERLLTAVRDYKELKRNQAVDDLLKAAELGISLPAYQWFTGQIALAQGHAVAEALKLFTETISESVNAFAKAAIS